RSGHSVPGAVLSRLQAPPQGRGTPQPLALAPFLVRGHRPFARDDAVDELLRFGGAAVRGEELGGVAERLGRVRDLAERRGGFLVAAERGERAREVQPRAAVVVLRMALHHALEIGKRGLGVAELERRDAAAVERVDGVRALPQRLLEAFAGPRVLFLVEEELAEL